MHAKKGPNSTSNRRQDEQNEDFIPCPKKMNVGCNLKVLRQAFGHQNGSFWDTYGSTQTLQSSSSIFEGCTLRFAWFCNGRPLIFAPRNKPRGHFFIDCTNPLSENTKRGPRTLQTALSKLDTTKSDFLLQSLRGGFAVFLPWTLEMVYRYTC